MGRTVQIVQTAQHRPGGDLITGDPAGPFLDLGLTLGAGKARKNDRIYLSLKHIAPVLRDEGWLTAEDVEELVDEVGRLRAENERLTEADAKLDAVLEAVSQFFEPEVVEREVIREVPRKPTEGELRAYVRKNRTDLLRTQDRESDERYRETYKGHGYVAGDRTPSKPLPGVSSEPVKDESPTATDDTRVPTTEERDENRPENVVSHFELEGQTVNLDDVLGGSIKEVIAYADGHGDEFKEALVEREYALGEMGKGAHPRKGVIEGLGYVWDEEASEEDEPEHLFDDDLEDGEDGEDSSEEDAATDEEA